MRDRVKIKVFGGRTTIINRLNQADIAVFGAQCKTDGVIFEIDGKNLRHAQQIFENDGFRVQICNRRGAGFTIKKACQKIGLILGTIAIFAGFFAYSFLVVDVEICGDPVNQTEVMALLNDQGVLLPAFAPNYDYKKLEVALLSLNGVSSATVLRTGNRLKITFLNELPPPPLIDMTQPLPVLSAKNAVVTRLVLLSGTALCKAGDTVRRGQTLIAPYLKVGESEVAVRGVGEVYGEVYHEKKLVYPDTVLTKSRTGRKTTQVSVHLFGISTKVTSPYASFEEEVEVVCGSPILPVQYRTHTFFETEDVAVPFCFEKMEDLLVKEGFSALLMELPAGARVLERFYSAKRVDNSTVLGLYYKTEELLNER